jgi:hypothetical protein
VVATPVDGVYPVAETNTKEDPRAPPELRALLGITYMPTSPLELEVIVVDKTAVAIAVF